MVCFSCNNKENIKSIRISTDNNDKYKFSDLFTDLSIIIPQTNEESLFGIDIVRLEVHKDKLFLLNQKQAGKNILCFDNEGRFLFSIDRIGNGPGEYSHLGDFFIDRKKECLIIVGESNKWFYFDLDGVFLYSEEDPENTISYYTDEFNDSLYVSYTGCSVKDCNNVKLIDRSTRKNVYLISSEPEHDVYTPSLPISMSKDNKYYYCGNDTIYNITSQLGSVVPVYCLDFGDKHRKFKQRIKNIPESDKLARVFNEYKDDGFKMTRFFVANKDYFSFNYFEMCYGDRNVVYDNIFYNIKTKKSICSKNLKFDVLGIDNSINISVVGCFDDYFYAVINDDISVANLEKIKSSKYISNASNIDSFSIDEMSNSIILKFK